MKWNELKKMWCECDVGATPRGGGREMGKKREGEGGEGM